MGVEWIVRHNGKIVANEESETEAMAMAAYNLMYLSRNEAERRAIEHEQAIGNPKVGHVWLINES